MTITHELLHTLNQPIPRYTSYPTAPTWGAFSQQEYTRALESATGSLSLYFHIPFCRTMCLYCGCSVVLNRKPENEERYVRYLKREIELVASKLATKRVTEIHFGGGTPTQISTELFSSIFEAIHANFSVDADAEISIEIDPRTVGDGKKLESLKALGVNRVSFGVQDTDPHVQEAVKRRQSREMTFETYYRARSIGFQSINIDLIYGLPLQTLETFKRTCRDIIELYPDRIALFSYAKVPWLKAHQKAIPEAFLPTTDEKFEIYLMARAMFQEAGYLQIGMDHFSAPNDPMSAAYRMKKLHRNFQGYTTYSADHLVGFGMTAIGSVAGSFVQNKKELASYYEAIDGRELPIERGKSLDASDQIRQYVIQQLMCHFELDKGRFFDRFNLVFDEYFREEKRRAIELPDLVIDTEKALQVTPRGELFMRNVAACFDAYLKRDQTAQFSRSV